METPAVTFTFPPEVIEAIAERTAELVLERLGKNTDAAPTEKYLDVAGALAYLSWGERGRAKLYSLTSRGAIPHGKHGGRLFFEREALDDWLAQFTKGSNGNGGVVQSTTTRKDKPVVDEPPS